MTVPLAPTQIKQAKREAREIALAAKQLALPDKRYGVIVADPPWRWESYSRETGMDRAADNHYPTSGVDEIAALPVPTIAHDDCVLFLWATVPCLEFALAVMKAWGFAYKSQFVWVKDRIGLGFWSRNKHEILLVGTRGHIPAPAPGTQWASVIEAPVGAHSVKPDKALEMIESYFPHLNATRRPPHIKARVLMSNRITTN
jgi:N6-adenosine-specific RNA methylase IME4